MLNIILGPQVKLPHVVVLQTIRTRSTDAGLKQTHSFTNNVRLFLLKLGLNTFPFASPIRQSAPCRWLPSLPTLHRPSWTGPSSCWCIVMTPWTWKHGMLHAVTCRSYQWHPMTSNDIQWLATLVYLIVHAGSQVRFHERFGSSDLWCSGPGRASGFCRSFKF